jgi:hypothetical protein
MKTEQNDGYKAKALEYLTNIDPIEQIACSPEINPIGTIWDEISERYISNEVINHLYPISNKVFNGFHEPANGFSDSFSLSCYCILEGKLESGTSTQY